MFTGHTDDCAGRKVTALSCGVLILAVLLLYGRSIGFGFVWDDRYFVVQNSALRSWKSVPSYFTDVTTYSWSFAAPMYRPLRNISYLVDYRIAGLNPAWFHAVNVLLHALTACAAYLLIRALYVRLAARRPDAQPGGAGEAGIRRLCIIPFIAALWWTIHPVHTEPVGWVKGRDEMLFALFYFPALLLWLPLADGTAHRRILLRNLGVLTLYTASLLSKEMAVSFPVVLAWILVLLPQRSMRQGAPAVVGSVVITLVFILVRHRVLGGTAQRGYISGNLYHEVLTTSTAFLRYITVSLVPANFLADYKTWPVIRSPAHPRLLLSLLVMGILIALAAWAAWKKRRLIAFGIGFYFLTLLPVTNVVPTMQFLAERFLYLPLAGFAIALAGMLDAVAVPWYESSRANLPADQWTRKRNLIIFAGTALLAVMALSTSLRLPVWKSDETLFQATYADDPANPRAAFGYAATLIREKRYQEAFIILKDIEKTPSKYELVDRALFQQAMGVILMRSGQMEEGGLLLKKSLEARPSDASTLTSLGTYHGLKGEHQEALEYFRRALEIEPSNEGIRENYNTALGFVEAGGPK